MPGPKPSRVRPRPKAEQTLLQGTPMQIAIWIIVILLIAALVKYLLHDSKK